MAWPADIGQTVVDGLGKSFRPAAVHLVPALPKTRNGKILRRVARAAYLGIDPGDVSALEDPTTLEPIRAAHGLRPMLPARHRPVLALIAATLLTGGAGRAGSRRGSDRRRTRSRRARDDRAGRGGDRCARIRPRRRRRQRAAGGRGRRGGPGAACRPGLVGGGRWQRRAEQPGPRPEVGQRRRDPVRARPAGDRPRRHDRRARRSSRRGWSSSSATGETSSCWRPWAPRPSRRRPVLLHGLGGGVGRPWPDRPPAGGRSAADRGRVCAGGHRWRRDR